jgi:hypothetical protein
MTSQDQELTSKQKRRPAEFTASFRVEPGSHMRMRTDLDPSLRLDQWRGATCHLESPVSTSGPVPAPEWRIVI